MLVSVSYTGRRTVDPVESHRDWIGARAKRGGAMGYRSFRAVHLNQAIVFFFTKFKIM